MRRIVVIAAGMAGITTATRIKRALPASETIIVVPSALEKLRASYNAAAEKAGPATRRLAAGLPDMVRLPTRRVGIVEAQDIMPDLTAKEVTVTSSRGSVTLRYSDLILEAPASVRLPRALQNASNVFAWPQPGFSAEPDRLDKALAGAAAQDQPVIVVGKGVHALEAVLLARESGALAHWLLTGEKEVADMDPLLLQLTLKRLGTGVRITALPETSPDKLGFTISQEDSHLAAITLPDGAALHSPCIIWTSPLMGRHPILREEGVYLDIHGQLAVQEGATDGLYVMGNGSAVDPAVLPGTEFLAPLYPGCQDYAEASALGCLGAITGDTKLASLAVSYGAASACGDDLLLWRAGYSLAGASAEDIEAEYGVSFLADEADGVPRLILSLICCKESRTIIGAQALAFGQDMRLAAEGLCGLCVAALATGDTLDELYARPNTGRPGRLFARTCAILRNKLLGQENGINGISPDELLASHEAGAEFFTLDLRPLQDWKQGHVAKAYNIPLLQLKKRLQDEVPRFSPIVLISEDGSDAYAAASKLSALGASSLYVLDGGMHLWPYDLEQE